MLIGRYVDPAEEYEQCAAFCARHFGGPVCRMLMEALTNAPRHVLDDIDANPHLWDDKVHLYVHLLTETE